MKSVAICRFRNQDVCLGEWYGWCQDRVPGSSYIACIGYSFDLSLLNYLDTGNSAAEHMTGTGKTHLYILINPEIHIGGYANKQIHAGSCIFLGIYRCDKRESF